MKIINPEMLTGGVGVSPLCGDAYPVCPDFWQGCPQQVVDPCTCRHRVGCVCAEAFPCDHIGPTR